MHILFLTENYPPEVNASATRVSERLPYWIRDGHKVTIVTCFPNFPQGRLYPGWRQKMLQIEESDGVRVVRVRTYISRNEGFVKRTVDFISFMVAAIIVSPRLPRPDVVVATSPQFFAAVGGWVVSRLKRRPFVFELGDLWPASIRAVGAIKASTLLDLVEKVELYLYRQSAAVVALTDAFKQDLVRRGIDPNKISVVINGVDLPRYAPRDKEPSLLRDLGIEGRFVIGYIGTHGLAHDLGNVIEAAESLRDRPNICFLFVGDGAAKQTLMAAARTRGLANVRFVDPRPKSDMPAYWSLCDAALIHLKNDRVFAEVIPSKMFEAMAMGLPLLVVAPTGEATRIVESEQAGMVVPAGQPALLAQAAIQLLDDPVARRKFAVNSLAAAPRYSRQRQAEDMARVLERVVDPGSATS